MKNILNIQLLLIILVSVLTFQQCLSSDHERKIYLDSVTVIEEFKNSYQSGDYYFGGQPSLENLRWLKSEGVKTVINLRSEKENNHFTETAFDEKEMTEELGMQYLLVPVEGMQSYNPVKLSEFANAIDKSAGKIYIHCGSCYRVTYLFMAYLIEYQNYPINKVLDFGKKLKYSMPLEGLLASVVIIKFVY